MKEPKQNIVFAAVAPHPPLLLPSVGSENDREKVKKTIENLEFLGKKLKETKPNLIIISSPHQDWGFNVPLYFLVRQSLGEGGFAKDFRGKIETFLTSFESPQSHFEEGKKVYQAKIQGSKSRVALIGSGDLSHCLKEDGPYGLNPDGPKFDNALIEALKKKDIQTDIKLDKTFPQAGECGLRSFCFLLGILEESEINYTPEILSYEGPFGVGYLVANFKINQ